MLLGKIRARVQDNLRGQPNYTCTQTVERSRRAARSNKFTLIDTLRLEVALVNGREMHSWPGAEKFEERDLVEWAGGGTIGNGDFALFARAVFLSGAGSMIYAGREMASGRETHKLSFDVPIFSSGYNIRVSQQRGIVGYRGAAWVDADNLDLRRLEFETTDIPPNLPILKGRDLIEYERQRIGEEDYLLPKSSEMALIGFDGTESRNRTSFSNCRQYGVTSSLRFDDPGPSAPPPVELVDWTLPEEIGIQVKLLAPLDSKKAAVGDSVPVEVARDAKRKGVVLVPKGARARLRVTRLDVIPRPTEYLLLGLALDGLSFENKRVKNRFSLDAPKNIGFQPHSSSDPMRSRGPAAPVFSLEGGVVENIIQIRGAQAQFKAGWQTDWSSQAPPR